MNSSDSLEPILSHLSTRVINSVTDGSNLRHLRYLLEFLAAWEKRPAYLTRIAYQWCSALSEVAGGLGPSRIPTRNHFYFRLRPQELATRSSYIAERGFSAVARSHNPTHPDVISDHAHGHPQHPDIYPHLLSITLEIGFRCVALNNNQSALHLDHTPHNEWVFETAFSSSDDEAIADALCAFIVGRHRPPPGSYAHYLAKRVESDTPFPPRLQQVSIRTLERIWRNELKVSGFVVRWLHRLNIDADDMVEKGSWAELLIEMIRTPMGPESLSSHYWRLLDKLVVTSRRRLNLALRDMEVMRSLEEAEDWEKLGVWMGVVWSFLPYSRISESMEGIEQVTLKLLLQRPSTLQGFERICDAGALRDPYGEYLYFRNKLKQMCDQARVEQLPSESPPP